MRICSSCVGEAHLLAVSGTLNSATYRTVRDTVIKAALDEPAAVLVDVDALSVPAQSAWSVFTSARWHVSRWPNVPIALICTSALTRRLLRRNGIDRYVPVHPTADEALADWASTGLTPRRLRARRDLPAERGSLDRARSHVRDCLVDWHREEYVPTASVVTTVLVENALDHTQSPIVVRLECEETVVIIAVDDGSSVQAVRTDPDANRVPGLEVLATVTRAWGNLPSATGKTVWAAIGQDDLLGL
jgi:hypothetical protein